MDIEYLNQKMQLISSMQATNLFPKKFILRYVMKMTTKEINDLSFFKGIEANEAMNQASSFGGIGTPSGGLTDMTQPTAVSNNSPVIDGTENVINQELIVKMFGKDILLEHKEDIGKLFKALEDYNKEQKNTLNEEKLLEEKENENSIFSEFVKLLGNKKVDNTNDEVISLIFENELGGLNYQEHKFNIYSRKNKKKGKEEVLTESEETIKI